MKHIHLESQDPTEVWLCCLEIQWPGCDIAPYIVQVCTMPELHQDHTPYLFLRIYINALVDFLRPRARQRLPEVMSSTVEA